MEPHAQGAARESGGMRFAPEQPVPRAGPLHKCPFCEWVQAEVRKGAVSLFLQKFWVG